MKKAESDQSFPALNKKILRKHAERWAKRYPNIIDRIFLCQYSPESLGDYGKLLGGGRLPSKYAVVFEMIDLDLSDIEIKTAFEKLKSDTCLYETLSEERTYENLIENDFKEVYKIPPANGWLHEWRFFLKKKIKDVSEEDLEKDYTAMGVRYDRHKWTLFTQKPLPDKIKTLRPSQKARIECRAIAEKKWEKDPTITIADMIVKPEIIPHTKRKDGKYYTDKTVYNWIKGLCPDRTPGRRKRT